MWPFSPATEIPPSAGLDTDHTIAFKKHGPPGQTGLGNLGPLSRGEHRPKTVGAWQGRQPDPGTFVWRSPNGWISITTNQGTLMLGDSPWTHDIWNTARSSAQPATAG